MHSSPQVGESVPIFKVKDSKGQEISPDMLMGHPYILYFYPKNETPGCIQEACDLRDHHAEFNQLDAHIIGISPDTNASHKKFMGKYDLNFNLVSDPFYELSTLFGVWEEKKSFGQTNWGVTRTTFVVDAKGIIRWMEKPVKIEGHAERILQALHELPKAFESL